MNDLQRCAIDLVEFLEVDHWCDQCENKQEHDMGDWCPLIQRVIALRDAAC